ncbi:ATP-binding protein [Candidatus Parcubacteria bacterium]|nr:ATP-binding protein [Candidatus Parcubacteria bacterium]
MYNRIISKQIKNNFFKGKVIIIVGPRQVGKTTLSLEMLKTYDKKDIVKFNCDNPGDRENLNNSDLEFLVKTIGTAKIIFIDEGQKVKTIGQTLKLLVDHYGESKQILVTGSSSFNLIDKTEEALTGRKFVYHLYPLSFEEIFQKGNILEFKKELENFMIFGNYPEIAKEQSNEERIERLKNLASSYLYKDILEFQNIKDSDILRKLLKALALQIGSEVSYTELANLIGVDKKTIERYVDLLEKNFIIFRLSPYFKNKRKEISKLRKIYFYDVGIRNAIINNFNFLDSRNDQGQLWENLAIIERMKYQAYHKIYANNYFWRAYSKAEIDFIEERDGKLYGFEFKWGNKKGRIPQEWQKDKNSEYKTISPDDVIGFWL